jgi:transcriptional regulator with XRE-family HTH domain
MSILEDVVDNRQSQLGSLLELLRRRARMSQRELSRASGISYTQIGDLERGDSLNPSPQTLRSLARGLATDNFSPEGYDAVREDAFYRQLMDSAGYLRGLPVGVSARDGDYEITEDDVVRYLARLTGDADLAAKLAKFADRYPSLSSDEQTTMRYVIGTLLKEE